MARMRASVLPGVSAHASAHALAQLYAALGSGRLVPPALLAQAQQLSTAGVGAAGESVRYGLGFVVGSCAELGPLSQVNVKLVNDAVGLVNDAVRGSIEAVRGRGLGGGGSEREGAGARSSQLVYGHAGLGGSIGLCIPEKRVALAITVNKLSGPRTATKRLLDLLLGEVGLAAPVGL